MIYNTTENTGNEHINAMRRAFEHRATWFALLVGEAKKRGLDISFARDAIWTCGCRDGEFKFDPNCTDIEEFTNVFATEDIKNIFDMDCVVDKENNKLTCTFHYCPLVAAWEKLGLSEDEINVLCDVAMDGDRAIAAKNPNMVFELGDTIGAGCKTCVASFTINAPKAEEEVAE